MRQRGLGAALCVVAALLVPSPAFADELTVVLEAPSGTQVVQGRPLQYLATVSNPAPDARTTTITFGVAKEGDPTAVPFRRWTGTVGGGSYVVLEGDVVASQWFDGLGSYGIVVEELPASLQFEMVAPPVAVPRFQDVTESAGLAAQHGAFVECDNYSAGAAWSDVDADGDLDLYMPNQTAPALLWINDGGHFTERAAAAGADNGGRVGVAAVAADYDNDGDQDMYVVNDGTNRLLRNDGLGNFEDVAVAAGVADAGPGTSAAWGDYDSDGLLDLYVVNYGRCEENMRYYDDVLYHNEGDGTFTDRTALLHATGSTRGVGFQASWFDYDDDGDIDLYLANDYVGPDPRPNVLWRNDGPGASDSWTFTNVSDASGAGVAINTMGTGIGDYDRDGDLDLVLSNIGPSVLLHNSGTGTFTDRAALAGVDRPEQRLGRPSITWAMEFRDLNNDGWEDLYVAAGDLLGATETDPQPNGVFANAGDGTFLDLSAASGADDAQHSRGVAVADYDRDGWLDLFVVNQTGTPRLYRNVTADPGSHWLEVALVGVASNRDGCGARIVVELPDHTAMRRDVFCGSTGLASGSEPAAHFGLGAATQAAKLTVDWPSGTSQVLQGVSADRLVTITEPVGPVNAPPRAADDSTATAEDVAVTIDVLANDYDPDGDVLVAHEFAAFTPGGGTVSCDRSGACAYAPAVNWSGTDRFRYRVSDSRRGFASAEVTITVVPVDDPPEAADDRATTAPYVPVVIPVLGNDVDPDGGPLAVEVVSAPGHGTTVVDPDGTVTYTPDPTFGGSDAFVYAVRDGGGAADTAVVTVVEEGCGEEGPASGRVDTLLEPVAGMLSFDLARLLHDLNCSQVVPLEGLLWADIPGQKQDSGRNRRML